MPHLLNRGRNFAILLGTGATILLAAQLIRPPIPNPPVTADLAAPPEVKEILRTSCYDCHSNETKLRWFDQIVPAYWLVARDVKTGRQHLNFSEIGQLPAAVQKGILYEAVNQIQLGAMPLRPYTRLHPDALVQPSQLQVLKNYLKPPAEPIVASESDLTSDKAQLEHWLQTPDRNPTVPPAPNGIEFLPDYRNWQAISTTDRFDNQTLRAILGNPISIKAIAEKHTDPWPDGTAFAKIAWLARNDGNGKVSAGAFFQVEFMIKDQKKFAATLGWGFARWRQANLVPYGKEAAFTNECVGCHTPVRRSDYVYTVPLRPQATDLPANLPWNPLAGKVLTVSVDPRNSLFSTLYGNDVAAQYARSSSGLDYPAGSAVCLVTWQEQDDARWFGGRIPGGVRSVECAGVTARPDGQKSTTFESYAGSPLTQTPGDNTRRAAELFGMRPAVLP
jgi:Haem-binding domain/Cytochrome P460